MKLRGVLLRPTLFFLMMLMLHLVGRQVFRATVYTFFLLNIWSHYDWPVEPFAAFSLADERPRPFQMIRVNQQLVSSFLIGAPLRSHTPLNKSWRHQHGNKLQLNFPFFRIHLRTEWWNKLWPQADIFPGSHAPSPVTMGSSPIANPSLLIICNSSPYRHSTCPNKSPKPALTVKSVKHGTSHLLDLSALENSHHEPRIQHLARATNPVELRNWNLIVQSYDDKETYL